MNEERMKELLKGLVRFAKDQMIDDFHAVMLLKAGIGMKKSELEELGFSFPNFNKELEEHKAHYSNAFIEWIENAYEA